VDAAVGPGRFQGAESSRSSIQVDFWRGVVPVRRWFEVQGTVEVGQVVAVSGAVLSVEAMGQDPGGGDCSPLLVRRPRFAVIPAWACSR